MSGDTQGRMFRFNRNVKAPDWVSDAMVSDSLVSTPIGQCRVNGGDLLLEMPNKTVMVYNQFSRDYGRMLAAYDASSKPNS